MRKLDIIERITQSSVFISLGSFVNVMGFLRLYDSIERPDANYDGRFTIGDIGIHAKETFFATGDIVISWVAGTNFGQSFEMNVDTPQLLLSFTASFLLWLPLLAGLKVLITGKIKEGAAIV